MYFATYQTSHTGNLAIQTEKWSIPTDAAKALIKQMKANDEIGSGTYWESNLAGPTRRAIRAKAKTVTVYTAGFSTGDLATLLMRVNCYSRYAGAL